MASTEVLHVPRDHALNGLSEPMKQRFVAAQRNLLELEFPDAATLFSRAFSDLKIAIEAPSNLKDRPAAELGDLPAKELSAFFTDLYSSRFLGIAL